MSYELKNVNGHIEVYNEFGVFVFSADSKGEAFRELYNVDHDFAPNPRLVAQVLCDA